MATSQAQAAQRYRHELPAPLNAEVNKSTFLDQRGVEIRANVPFELVYVHDGIRGAEAGHDDHDACSSIQR